ncbi:hypothetical protein FBD94_09780 [Pedobacter hiemivivus]|uniref:SH3 domain-containing protein n=1 Tax=Pedobacter hiemivivus TaxID=2530454 RepID=A0A4U1GEH1_9SPHI|nr:hypothetical protein [Pedobacter hiemivivus]TKC62495.1 hypothetical protein FBD94_09780 [Pedobacter hiemivivus]
MKALKTFLFFIVLFSTLNIYASPYVTKQDINVRRGAGKGYEKMGIIKKGKVVEIERIEGKWGKTTFEGNAGFISMSFLSGEEGTRKSDSKSSDSLIGGIILGIIIICIFLKNSRFWRSIFPNYLGSPDAYKYRCTRCGEKYYYSNTAETCRNKKAHLMYKL